jgi:hypothetical protein
LILSGHIGLIENTPAVPLSQSLKKIIGSGFDIPLKNLKEELAYKKLFLDRHKFSVLYRGLIHLI